MVGEAIPDSVIFPGKILFNTQRSLNNSRTPGVLSYCHILCNRLGSLIWAAVIKMEKDGGVTYLF